MSAGTLSFGPTKLRRKVDILGCILVDFGRFLGYECVLGVKYWVFLSFRLTMFKFKVGIFAVLWSILVDFWGMNVF